MSCGFNYLKNFLKNEIESFLTSIFFIHPAHLLNTPRGKLEPEGFLEICSSIIFVPVPSPLVQFSHIHTHTQKPRFGENKIVGTK